MLSGSADYDGATTVFAGRLTVQGTLENKSSAVTVLSGAILGGQGTVKRAVNVQNGGIVAPGN